MADRLGGTLAAMAYAGPRAWIRLLVSGVVQPADDRDLRPGDRVVVRDLAVLGRGMQPVVALTDWIIEPIRRLLPPIGMIDFSPMVAWLVLWVLRGFVLGLL